MANTRISELTQLTSGELNRSDLLLIVDVVGTPQTKNVQLGDLSDYVALSAGSVPVADFVELSSSFIPVSSSVSSLNSITASLISNSGIGKLDNSLTGSLLTAYGLPTLDSSGYIYANFINGSMQSFNGRSGIVNSMFGDYSASMILFNSSSNIPYNNVQSAIKSMVSKTGYDTVTGRLYLTNAPTSSLEAVNKQYTDTFVSQSGGTMTGQLILFGNPTNNLGASPKQYTDTFVSQSGASMTGFLTLSAPPTSSMHAANMGYVDTFVSKSGGIMTGLLTLSANPTGSMEASTKKYTDTKVSLSGATMTGLLTLSANPTGSLEASTKQYTDTFVSKAGATMTGQLILPSINVNGNLIYVSSGTSSVGVGTTTPTQSAKLDVNGMIRASSIQFSDDTIQTSAGVTGGAVLSFYYRTGSVFPQKADYDGMYVDLFNGRSGSVTPQRSDYDLYYISNTGSGLINDGTLLISNNQFATPNETSSLLLSQTNIVGQRTGLGISTNPTSSMNRLVEVEDTFLMAYKTQIGFDFPQLDLWTSGIVIGNYTSGSNGIRISSTGVQIPNGLTQGVVLVSSSITLNSKQYYVCNATSSITITLPSASLNTGKLYTVKNKYSGSLIIDATSTGLLDGQTTSSLNQWSSVTIISDGSSWNNI